MKTTPLQSCFSYSCLFQEIYHASQEAVKAFIQEKGMKPGDILPLLRIALVGTMKGPAVFETAEVLGREETVSRLKALSSKM